MRALTVLYDSDCGLCQRVRDWLEDQPKYVEMEFVAAGSMTARARFPRLDPEETLREVTVVGDGGEVYQGAKAWLICLWALRRYRLLALDWSTPERMALAKRFVAWVSRNRPARGASRASGGEPVHSGDDVFGLLFTIVVGVIVAMLPFLRWNQPGELTAAVLIGALIGYSLWRVSTPRAERPTPR